MDPWHLVDLLVAGVVTVLAWIGKNQVSRIDKLEADKADKHSLEIGIADVKKSVETLEQQEAAQHAAITTRLDTLLFNMIGKGDEK